MEETGHRITTETSVGKPKVSETKQFSVILIKTFASVLKKSETSPKYCTDYCI